MNDKELYLRLEQRILARLLHARIRFQEDYWPWKLIPIKIRPPAITLGNTIWLSARANDAGTLAHEYQHLMDIDEMGLLRFLIMYLAPQISCYIPAMFLMLSFAFGSTLGIILFACLTALLLLPRSAPNRTWLEMRAYAVTLYMTKLRDYDSYNSEEFRNKIIDDISSWTYYKMISRAKAKKMVDEAITLLQDESKTCDISIVFRDINGIIHQPSRI